MTPTELIAVLAVYKVQVEAIVPEGWQVPNGYTLRGPRGNKTCLSCDANGNVDASALQLWLDGIAYGNAKLAKRGRA